MMTTTMTVWNYEALLKAKEELNNDSSVRTYRVIRENEYASEKFVIEINR